MGTRGDNWGTYHAVLLQVLLQAGEGSRGGRRVATWLGLGVGVGVGFELGLGLGVGVGVGVGSWFGLGLG